MYSGLCLYKAYSAKTEEEATKKDQLIKAFAIFLTGLGVILSSIVIYQYFQV